MDAYLYDREVAPQAHRAQAAILNGRAAELPPLLGLRCPPSRTDLRENTSNPNSPQARLFRVSPAERRHDDQRASRPKARGCAPPQLPRLLRMIRPDRGRVCGLLRYLFEATASTRQRYHFGKGTCFVRLGPSHTFGLVHARVGQIVTFFETTALAAPWAP